MLLLRVLHIDAREGLSADMLLAALIALMEEPERRSVRERMERASALSGLRFHLTPIEEDGDSGLAVAYEGLREMMGTVSYEQARKRLEGMGASLGPGLDIGIKILDRIFEAEGQAHKLPAQEVHLHEIGRAQALLNMAGVGHAYSLVSSPLEETLCSTITTGKGIVVTAHGPLKIPAPATAYLLRNMRHLPGNHPGERATPTGVAAASVISEGHSDDISKAAGRRGVGFGTKRFGGRLGRVIIRRL